MGRKDSEVICITCRQGERFCVCVRDPIARLRELTKLLEMEIAKGKELKDGKTQV